MHNCQINQIYGNTDYVDKCNKLLCRKVPLFFFLSKILDFWREILV